MGTPLLLRFCAILDAQGDPLWRLRAHFSHILFGVFLETLLGRLSGGSPPQYGEVGGMGGAGSGDQVILHVGPCRVQMLCVCAHSVQTLLRSL